MTTFTGILVSLITFLCGFNMLHSNEQRSTYKSPDYITYAHEIQEALAQEMEDEYGLVCIGTGGCMLHDVEKIGIMFDYPRLLSIDESRELELIAMKRMIELANQHERIRPFLREYPFPLMRACVKLSISKYDTDRSKVDYLFLAKGSLYYCKYNAKIDKVEELLVEPLEEALKIFENSPRKFLPKGKRSM